MLSSGRPPDMTDHLKHMIDLARTPEETEQEPFPPLASVNKYPYGLCISLCEDELKKLDIDYSDVSPGDMLHLHCMATVTSVSCNKTQDNDDHCRIELQITHMSGGEDEDQENEEEEESERTEKSAPNRLYKSY